MIATDSHSPRADERAERALGAQGSEVVADPAEKHADELERRVGELRRLSRELRQ